LSLSGVQFGGFWMGNWMGNLRLLGCRYGRHQPAKSGSTLQVPFLGFGSRLARKLARSKRVQWRHFLTLNRRHNG
jgi:hypothetical protein